MKQFQFEVKNHNNFRRELARVKRFCNNEYYNSVCFQLFTQITDHQELKQLTDIIEHDFPEADYYGCQSFGNIYDGCLSGDKTLVVCSITEYESTKSAVIYIDPTNPDSEYRTLDDLWEYCNRNLWVKGVELIASYRGTEHVNLCGEIKDLRPDVAVCGGISMDPVNPTNPDTYVFSKNYGVSTNAIIAVLMGGEDLHIKTSYISGWKGLGKSFEITKCQGNDILEIDGEQATDIYKKYLNIEKNEIFENYDMMFPLLLEHDGVECIRIPIPSTESTGLQLLVPPKEGMKVRLSYGDKAIILNHVRNRVKEMLDFGPETVRIYSCATRRRYWGDEKVSLETEIFDEVAPTIGFYTRGEILRLDNYLHYFNSTIVYSLIREGEAYEYDYSIEDLMGYIEDRSSLASKLIHYVGAVTGELEGQFNRTMLGMANIYKSMFLLDFEEKVLTQLDSDLSAEKILSEKDGFSDKMNHFIKSVVKDDMHSVALKFVNFDTLKHRMAHKNVIACELVGVTMGWFRAQMIVIDRDSYGVPIKFVFTIQVIDAEKKTMEEQQRIIQVLADTYNTLHLLDLDNDIHKEINTTVSVHNVVAKQGNRNNQAILHKVMENAVVPEHLKAMKEFTDLSTIRERLANDKMISREFLSPTKGWVKANFIVYERNDSGQVSKILLATQVIDNEKQKEQMLIHNSLTDELTGLLNRRAFEEDLRALENEEIELDFILASMDVNGLKVVNDDLGHAAGDELLIGAAACMKQCLGGYGKVYRIGGDEFAAILYTNINNLVRIAQDLDNTVLNWSGKMVPSLSISSGFVISSERVSKSLSKMMRIADQRMYANKEIFYQNKGVDRREMKRAYDMICDSYIKILKVNLTHDTYKIIKTSELELSKDRGFHEESISKWLYSFAINNQVHPDDKDLYLDKTSLPKLKEYFSTHQKAYAVHYKRLIGDEFKEVILELIPTSECDPDNLEVFLYVKNISS